MKPVLLVTGASRGIGAATAVLAAQRGWRVVVNYSNNRAAADDVARQIQQAGSEALVVQADVSDEAQIMAMFQRIDSHWGRLDGLVNNAGVVDVQSRVDDMTLARLERMFRLNVIGSFLCAREAVRRMSTRHGHGGGVIVNLSSAASRLGGAGQYVDYAASKGAIDSMTTGLALEVAAEGIRVNQVSPGIIDTEIHASGGFPGRAQAVGPNLPMKRAGTAQEVAQAIVWLLSAESSYTSGSNVDVTGCR
ncbi:MAG: SDR family oxidoreductase [Limnohabitans sp.]|jgi:NAD(P)-dependent dehydrogenase (short-subunit alcohol dehydrogenase family)|nr:SDR family oxidoreductase [Burkholderiaceae bacterium]